MSGWRSLALLLVLALLACAVGLAAGSSGWGFARLDIVREVRLPRVLAGFGAGAALALSGALLQLLTRNPLADPYVLGVSGGASVGALGTMLLAAAPGGGILAAIGLESAVALGAAAGAALATLLLLALSWRLIADGGFGVRDDGAVSLLLVGVMIGSASAAIVAMLLSLAGDVPLRGMIFWLMGDLNGATQWLAVWIALGVALAVNWPWAHQLDWMARGNAWASTLGANVVARRLSVLLAAALATGCAVATAGSIGFVGLVVPHALRLAGVRRAAVLLPACVLGGGSFVVLVDTLARTVAAPTQLPVGVLAAAIGVPAFLVLLLHPRAVAGGRRA